MNVRIFFITLVTVFFAELADKTQLVNLNMSLKSGNPMTVLLGSVSAYIIVTALTVLIGTLLAKFIKPDVVRYTAASLFIILGILMFAGKV